MEIKALRTKKIKAAKIGILSQKMFLLMTVFIIGLVFGTMSLRNPGDDYTLKTSRLCVFINTVYIRIMSYRRTYSVA